MHHKGTSKSLSQTMSRYCTLFALMCLLFQYYSVWSFYVQSSCQSVTSISIFQPMLDLLGSPTTSSIALCEIQRQWAEKQLFAIQTQLIALMSSLGVVNFQWRKQIENV